MARIHTRTTILLSIVILLALSVAAFSYFKPNQSSNKSQTARTDEPPINLSPPTEDEIKQGESTKLENNNKDPSSSDPIESTAVITNLFQQESGSAVIQTRLTGTGWDQCLLEVRQGESTVSLKAEVIFQSTYSSCAGFSVPRSDLGSGSWRFTLHGMKKNGSEVISDVKTLDIK